MRPHITLDQDYAAKFEHLAGELNTGADSLSRLQMEDELPKELLNEIYSIDELDHNENVNFPLAMNLVKEEQDKDTDLQTKLGNKK